MKRKIALVMLVLTFTCATFQGTARASETPKPCVIKGKVIKNMKNCPMEGCTGRGDGDLSSLKNRPDAPIPSRVKSKTISDIVALNSKSPKGLNAAKNAREHGVLSTLGAGFGEGTAVVVTGFLVHGDKSGLEVCNCFIGTRKTPETLDFHLNLSDTKGDPKKVLKQSLVVEISPRSPMRSKGWTLAKIKTLARRQVFVRVTGWLLYDSEHTNFSKMPRASAWEIHPITKFEVCTASNVEDCKDDKWVALEDLP